MTVAAILKVKGTTIHTASPQHSLSDAASILRDKSIGAVVVVDECGLPVGVLSERDIVRALADHGADILNRAVADFMTTNVITGTMCDSVDQVMEKMTHCRVRHIPIVDQDALAGIVSIGDVVRAKIDMIEAEAEALKSYITS